MVDGCLNFCRFPRTGIIMENQVTGFYCQGQISSLNCSIEKFHHPGKLAIAERALLKYIGNEAAIALVIDFIREQIDVCGNHCSHAASRRVIRSSLPPYRVSADPLPYPNCTRRAQRDHPARPALAPQPHWHRVARSGA